MMITVSSQKYHQRICRHSRNLDSVPWEIWETRCRNSIQDSGLDHQAVIGRRAAAEGPMSVPGGLERTYQRRAISLSLKTAPCNWTFVCSQSI